VSEHAKQDLIDIVGAAASPDRRHPSVRALPAAVTAMSDEETASTIDGVFGLGWRDYFIFFGAIEPKKNLGV